MEIFHSLILMVTPDAPKLSLVPDSLPSEMTIIYTRLAESNRWVHCDSRINFH